MAEILLIEDDDDVRLAIIEFLADEHVVRGVANGKEGLAYLAEHSPDLILLDLMMPVMDGWEFRRQQRALGEAAAKIPVIAISANDAANSRNAVADVFVGKPFRVSALLKAIADTLAKAGTRAIAASS